MSTLNLSFPDSNYTESNPPSAGTLKADISAIEIGHNAHEADTDNPHSVTAEQLNLDPAGTAAIAIMSALNPVGTIREFNVSTDPATLLGFGTWAEYGKGRVTVAIDATQTEFNTAEKTGGAKTHTLTTAEMPSHTHNLINNGTGVYYGGTGTGLLSASYPSGSTGGGGAHNNLQPYIVCYRWVRTA
jgi:hypothetical protein